MEPREALRIEPPFRLVYSFGSEHVPGSYGRVVVQIFADGRVLLDNVQRGAFTRSWEGILERATLERILGHLDEAGFPDVESHVMARGANLRVVSVHSGAREAQTRPIEWWAAAKMKGYGGAFKILDSVVAELSDGALPTTVVSEPGLVRRAERPSRPAIALDDAWRLGLAPALVATALVVADEQEREQRRHEVEQLLEKYGRSAPAAPVDAAQARSWARDVHRAAEEIVSGPAAEAFALGRAVGEIRLALEEGPPARMDFGIGLLQLSRHPAAREIAALAMQRPADWRDRLAVSSGALRVALG